MKVCLYREHGKTFPKENVMKQIDFYSISSHFTFHIDFLSKLKFDGFYNVIYYRMTQLLMSVRCNTIGCNTIHSFPYSVQEVDKSTDVFLYRCYLQRDKRTLLVELDTQ